MNRRPGKHSIGSSGAYFFSGRQPTALWMLFIPHPLTHFRLLDCVEVHRSSRHLEDHIQSIQVLNCSSLDLHMLCVCA
jgi:hypothetical protein